MSSNTPLMLLADAYKLFHRGMYPKGTQFVYSTWTARTSRIPGVNEVVHFGVQSFLVDLMERFAEFFNTDIQRIVTDYKRFMHHCYNIDADTSHIEALHQLGYVPLLIKSLPEGSVVPIRTPLLTIQNTHPEHAWLTNFVESWLSSELWQASTSATIAREYRRILDAAALRTVGNTDFVDFQGHDFSMRGMSSIASGIKSGMGHLTAFKGTDSNPAILEIERVYGDSIASHWIGTSIPASEHSIQCAYGDDVEYFRRLITEVHPEGSVSVVCDGYDFWDVIGRVLPLLKNAIMNRRGRVVIRPDSGDPVLIVCGDPSHAGDTPRDQLIVLRYF